MMLKPAPRQKGATIVTLFLWWIVLVAMLALAFDVGHLLTIRNELQTSADAAALAGANCLDRATAASGNDCTATFSKTLNWAVASTKATNSIGLNKSDNRTLVDSVVQTGYWNLNGGTAVQPTSLSPLGPCTMSGGVMVTACDKPAVRVTVSRATGSNGGSVNTMIGTLFGLAQVPISASAVAVISTPSQVLPGAVIPIVINLCMFNQFWDTANNLPVLFKSTDVDPYNISTIGQPWELRIGSAYQYGPCQSGQWTSFGTNTNDKPTVEGFINNGNPQSMAIGQNTWIQSGVVANLYDTLAAKYLGKDVTVLVVDQPQGLNGAPNAAPIQAFAGFHIDAIVKNGANSYLQGHFISGSITNGSSGVGPSFGTYTPPRLAQ